MIYLHNSRRGHRARGRECRPSRLNTQPLDYFVDDRIRVAAARGDGPRHPPQLVFPDALVQCDPEESITQHLNYSMLGHARAAAVQLILVRRNIVRITLDGLRQAVQPPVFNRHGLYYRRSPAVGPIGDGKERFEFSFRSQHAFPVGLIDGKDIPDLHYPGFDRLDIVAHSVHENDHRYISRLHDVYFILSDANSLDNDLIIPARIEYRHRIDGRPREPSEIPSSRHAANKDAGIHR